jgi:hypothetical protein
MKTGASLCGASLPIARKPFPLGAGRRHLFDAT